MIAVNSGTENTGVIPSDTLAASDTGMEALDHGSAPETTVDETLFNDLQNLPSSTDSSSAATISQLQGMAAQGKLLFDEGKTNNNSVMMKFGGYVWKKADTLAKSLESGETLDKQMVDNYLAQFQGYLTQLKAQQTNGNTSAPQAQSGQIPSNS